MKNLIVLFTLILMITLVLSCEDNPCYANFSTIGKDFIAYEKYQKITMIDTNNVVHHLVQTKYIRDFQESCGILACSNDFRERYEVEYKSASDETWGFHLCLYSKYCDQGDFEIFNISNKLSDKYDTNTWIFFENTNILRIKYDFIDVNGITFSDVYELTGYIDKGTLTILYNHQYGIIQILFPNNKSIDLIL